MGLKADWTPLDIERLEPNFPSWKEGLARPTQKALAHLQAMLAMGVPRYAIVEFSTKNRNALVHGVEIPFKSPSFRPRGFLPLSSLDAAGNLALPVLSTPINYNRSDKRDGWYGMVAVFSPPIGRISLRKSANQTLTTGTTTAVTWDVIDSSGSLSLVSGSANVICAEAGLVDVRFTVSFAINNVGQRRAYVTKNNVNAGSGDRKSHQAIPTNNPTTARATNTAGSALWEVAAGDSLQIRVFQDTGANLDITGNGLDECQLDATYTQPPRNYSANVTGILWGD